MDGELAKASSFFIAVKMDLFVNCGYNRKSKQGAKKGHKFKTFVFLP